MNKLIWNNETLNLLTQKWSCTSNKALGALLNCSPTSVVNKAKELNLKPKRYGKFNWTPEIEAYLISNWTSKSYEELKKVINCSNSIIKKKATELNLGHKNSKYLGIPDIPAIYKIYFINSNKFYIGMTCSVLRKRYGCHISELVRNIHRNRKLQAEFDKYGQNAVRCEVLQELKPHTSNYKALEIESFWIHKLNPELNILKHKIGDIK
jgi:hypothetical protein